MEFNNLENEHLLLVKFDTSCIHDFFENFNEEVTHFLYNDSFASLKEYEDFFDMVINYIIPV